MNPVLLLMLLGACRDDPPDTATPDTPDTDLPDTDLPDTDLPDTDTSDTAPPDTGPPDTGPPDTGSRPTLSSGAFQDGRVWHVTQMATEEPWAIVVVEPLEKKLNVPVLIGAYGGLAEDPSCDELGPSGEMLVDLGAVEVRVLGGLQCCAGICSESTADIGGPYRQQALRDLMAFTRGELTTVDGLTISELIRTSVDPEDSVLIASSAVGHMVLSSIAAEPTAFEQLSGITLFEVPIQTEGISKYLGLMPWDDDDRVDSNLSGCSWDDGGTPWYQDGACSTGACEIPQEKLAWTDEWSTGDLITYSSQIEGGDSTPGMLFIDGDGDGVMTLSKEGHPDRDGSGAIDTDEDFPLPGMLHYESDLSDRYYLSPSVLEAALSAKLLQPEAWPAHLHTEEETAAFWGERDGYGALTTITKALPDVRWQISASSRDHGIPLCSRPHVVNIYRQLQDLGAEVVLGPDTEALRDVLGVVDFYYDPLPEGAPLTTGTIHAHLPPPIASSEEVRTAAVLDLFRRRSASKE